MGPLERKVFVLFTQLEDSSKTQKQKCLDPHLCWSLSFLSHPNAGFDKQLWTAFESDLSEAWPSWTFWGRKSLPSSWYPSAPHCLIWSFEVSTVTETGRLKNANWMPSLRGGGCRGLEEHRRASRSGFELCCTGPGRKESASSFLSASTWMLLSAFLYLCSQRSPKQTLE